MKTNSLLWAIVPFWQKEEADLSSLAEMVKELIVSPEGLSNKRKVSIRRSGVEPLSSNSYSYLVGNVAVIPVQGPIRNRFGAGFSYQELIRDLNLAIGDERVDSIFLDVESPGGMVSGIDEAVDAIVSARQKKPVYAHIGAIGASAAYMLACCADVVTASKTSIIGSVGALISYTDATGILEHFGAKTVTVVASQSPNKRFPAGSQELIDELQPIVDESAELFISMLAGQRGVSVETIMKDYGQGSVFPSGEAFKRKMVDGIVTTSEALDMAANGMALSTSNDRAKKRVDAFSNVASLHDAVFVEAEQTPIQVIGEQISKLIGGQSLGQSISVPVVERLATLIGNEDAAADEPEDDESEEEEVAADESATADEEVSEEAPEEPSDDETQNEGEDEMSNTSAQIVRGFRETQQTLHGQIAVIKDRASRRDNKKFTQEEQTEIRTLNAQIQEIESQIQTYNTSSSADAFMDEPVQSRANPEPLNTERREAPTLLSSPTSEGWKPMQSAGYAPGALGLGQMARDIIDWKSNGRKSEALEQLAANGHEGEKGGFFLPESVQKPLKDASMSQLSLLDLCDVDTDVDDYSFEVPVDDSQPWDTVRGPQAQNVPEGDTADVTDISLDKRRMELGKVQVMVKVTDRLMKTVSTLGRFISNKASQRLAWKISYDIARGNGTNKALGFLNSGALVTVAAEGSQAADSLVAENISKMIAANSSSEGAFDNLMFLMHPELVPQADILQVKATSEVMSIARGDTDKKRPRQLFGVPFRTHQICAKPGDLGDIMLLDLKQYYAPVFRGGIEMKVSEEAGFKEDEIWLKFTIHLGGIPYLNAPIASRDGTFVQSPFVVLAAR